MLGSGGQIGAPLCRYLAEEGHEVQEWDIDKDPKMDLRWPTQALSESIQTADFVFFLAFDVGGSTYLKNYQHSFKFIENNISIMENVFDDLVRFHTPFIFASSQMSNMGHSPYGVLKRLGEFYTKSLGGLVVRFWNVYGPEHDPEKFHVITDFINMANREGRILVRTTGEEKRNFLHVDDCSNALVLSALNLDKILDESITYTHSERVPWEDGVVDIAGNEGQWISIRDLALLIGAQTRVPVYFGLEEDDVQGKYNMPNKKLSKLTNWYPIVDIGQGVAKIIKEMSNG